MDFYQSLLTGNLTLQDLTDDQLKQLRAGWWGNDIFHPNEFVWDNARIEQNRRKLEVATRAVAEVRAKRRVRIDKDKNFFKE